MTRHYLGEFLSWGYSSFFFFTFQTSGLRKRVEARWGAWDWDSFLGIWGPAGGGWGWWELGEQAEVEREEGGCVSFDGLGLLYKRFFRGGGRKENRGANMKYTPTVF